MGAARHIEEHLGAGVDVFLAVLEEDGADLLADVGAPGVADDLGVEARGAGGVCEASELGGLARSVGALEDEEGAGEGAGEVCRERFWGGLVGSGWECR